LKKNLPQWLVKRPISHRGLHGVFNSKVVPENSLLAFEHSIEKKFPIELDVHMLRDGSVVVFHDETLDRLTSVSGRIEELSKENLKNLYLLKTEQTIPLLSQVLSLVAGRVPLLIELKGEHSTGILEKHTWELLKDYQGEFAVQSFNPYSMMWFQKHAGQVLRGLLSYDYSDSSLPIYKKLLLKNLIFAAKVLPDFLAIDKDYLEAWPVQLLHKTVGLPLIAWTVSSLKESNQASQLAQNVIFENFIPATMT